MARALGIDPGTRSFDLVVIDGPRVVWEKSIDTVDIARDPKKLLEAIEEAGPVDIVAGPSGYGTPVVCNEDILDARRFAIEILLLSTEKDIEEGLTRGELGIAVYSALARVVEALWRSRWRVCYIPSVILLPTVPLYRKLNRVDMGTADKLAVTALAVYDQSKRLGVGYEETRFILVEMGFGYNAVIAVDGGKIVDGYGGTLVPMGFLTIGPIDAEIVAAGRSWSRSDVFYGGVSTACRELDPVKALEKALSDELCSAGFRAMIEAIERAVKGALVAVPKPREIIVSGRLSRIPQLFEEIEKRLENIAPVTKLRGLEGASIAKEAAQGMALIGEGLAGGYFKDLIEHIEIPRARGTVLDWILHPRVIKARERLKRACLESIKRKEVCVVL